MSNTLKQDTAVSMANELIAISAQVKAIYNRISEFNGRNTNNSPDTYWRLMATAPVNTDGSLGSADGSPNLAHPITVAGLNRAEADLLTGLTLAIELQQFCNGTLATNRAAVNRLPVLDTLIG